MKKGHSRQADFLVESTLRPRVFVRCSAERGSSSNPLEMYEAGSRVTNVSN